MPSDDFDRCSGCGHHWYKRDRCPDCGVELVTKREIPDWIHERAENKQGPKDVNLHFEVSMAVMYFGKPLPEYDPYKKWRRVQEQQRVERIERHLRLPDAMTLNGADS